MISAQTAKAKAAEAKINKEFAGLEKNINTAIKNGRDCAIHAGLKMEKENVEKLRLLGYKVEAQARGFRISWE